MAFFKQRIELRLAMHSVFRVILHRDHETTLRDVALSDDDLGALRRELPAFELALWHLHCVSHLGATGPQEVTKQFALGLADVLQDTAQARQTDALMEQVLSYLAGLEALDPAWPGTRGLPFCYCWQFAERVLPDRDFSTESARLRHHQVVDIGKQALQMTETAFQEMITKYRLV